MFEDYFGDSLTAQKNYRSADSAYAILIKEYATDLSLIHIYSCYQMSKLEDPEIKVKLAMVVTTYPGASAHQVELEVTLSLIHIYMCIRDRDYSQDMKFWWPQT